MICCSCCLCFFSFALVCAATCAVAPRASVAAYFSRIVCIAMFLSSSHTLTRIWYFRQILWVFSSRHGHYSDFLAFLLILLILLLFFSFSFSFSPFLGLFRVGVAFRWSERTNCWCCFKSACSLNVLMRSRHVFSRVSRWLIF